MRSSCTFCGMAALDGEPCCTWEYRRGRMKAADIALAALRAENEAMRMALEQIMRLIYPEEIVKDALPAGYGISAEEVGAVGPWFGLRLASGEERGWSRSYYKMDLGDVGASEPHARELADIARAALARKEKP